MKGVQRYSEHRKQGNDGVSISVIFRQLLPYKGNKLQADELNFAINVPWQSLESISEFWRQHMVNISNDIPMQTTWNNRLHFNLSGRHRCSRQLISSKNNRIISLLLTSPENNISKDGKRILLCFPSNHSRHPAVRNTKKLGLQFRVYCKNLYFDHVPKNCYLYCGNYLFSTSFKHNKRLYYLLCCCINE